MSITLGLLVVTYDVIVRLPSPRNSSADPVYLAVRADGKWFRADYWTSGVLVGEKEYASPEEMVAEIAKLKDPWPEFEWREPYVSLRRMAVHQRPRCESCGYDYCLCHIKSWGEGSI